MILTALLKAATSLTARQAASLLVPAQQVHTSSGKHVPRFALVRDVPSTFADSLKHQEPDEPINVDVARQQHSAYVDVLKKLVSEVFSIPADSHHPDCCFIEDTAVVAGSTAIITRPGTPSRLNELGPVARALRQLQPTANLRIHSITAPGALDGGDVLQVGNHLLIGLSRRTNQAAVYQVAGVLGDTYQVHAIPVTEGLHLKSAITALDDTTILAADNPAGHGVLDAIKSTPSLAHKFSFVFVPDAPAANVLRIGHNIVMQAGFPASHELLQSLCRQRVLQLHTVPQMTEVAKADGALTCCSILIP
eukprot:jgi/Chrzof1/6801/Cz19g10080.t1